MMDIRLGDVLTMKKSHPCGEKRWLVLGTDTDLKLRCLGCAHEVIIPRIKAEKSVKSIRHPENSTNNC